MVLKAHPETRKMKTQKLKRGSYSAFLISPKHTGRQICTSNLIEGCEPHDQTYTHHVVIKILLLNHVSPTTLSMSTDDDSEPDQQGHAPQSRGCQNSTVAGTATYVNFGVFPCSGQKLRIPAFFPNGLVGQNLFTATCKTVCDVGGGVLIFVERGSGRLLRRLAIYLFTLGCCHI
jgi:hypothetical protein